MENIENRIDYIIDYSTKNKSAIKMYKVLKDMGIKNNKFFLRLYDKKLVNVDPFSKKLTKEQEARILTEIKRNKWYYIREIVRVPVPGGAVMYDFNRGNLALGYCKSLNLNTILLLPRQNGKTIGEICDDTWIYHFGTKNTNILYGNKELGDSKLNIKRFKDIVSKLPDFIKDSILDPRKDTDNEMEIRSKLNDNSIKALASAKDVVSADKLGRGATTPILYWDEFAFLKFNNIIYGSASPAQSKAQEAAEKMGRPYGKSITTTPNNLDLPEGKYCKKMIDDACRFEEIMYDWSREKILAYIAKNSQNDFVHIEFSYKELGHDEEWFKKQCRALNNDLFMIKREILIQWTKATDNSPFTEEQLEMISSGVKEPIGKIFLQNYYKLEIYKDFPKDHNIIISVDCAGGLSLDSTAITLIHPTTLETLGHFKNNKIDTVDTTNILLELVYRYFPKAVLVIERNYVGKAVIDNLLRTPIAGNLYWEMRTKIAEKKLEDGRVKKEKTKTKVYGVNTDVKSREQMINEVLTDTVNNSPEVILAKPIYDDITTLERKKNNKIEHRDGEHDDSLFSYLIGRWVLSFGTNLAKFLLQGTNSTVPIGEIKSNMQYNLSFLSSLNNTDSVGSFSESIIRVNLEEEQKKKMDDDRYNKFKNILNLNN